MTLTLGGHFGQDVTLERTLTLVAGSGFFETLRSTTVGFHLWHEKHSAFAITERQCRDSYKVADKKIISMKQAKKNDRWPMLRRARLNGHFLRKLTSSFSGQSP